MGTEDGEADLDKQEGDQDTPPDAGKDKAEKPDRKSWIPREQFDQLVETVNRLATAVSQKPEPKKEEPAQQEKVLTRSELRAAVEKQQLTQEEADTLWDKQLLAQATKAAREVASQEVTVKQKDQRIEADLRQYKQFVPNAWKEGTEERAKVADEFKALVDLGLPNSRETELAAMRTVFGPVDKLASKPRSKPSVEHDEQAGGGGEGSDRTPQKDAVKGLDARTRAYYQKGIESGRYKDWNEVRSELSFRKPRAA